MDAAKCLWICRCFADSDNYLFGNCGDNYSSPSFKDVENGFT